jgi:copper chaperone CopZ
MTDFVLHISGMSCGHCLNAVSQAIAKLGNVQTVSVRLGRADLRVQDPALIDAAKIAIEDAGYRVESVTRS